MLQRFLQKTTEFPILMLSLAFTSCVLRTTVTVSRVTFQRPLFPPSFPLGRASMTRGPLSLPQQVLVRLRLEQVLTQNFRATSKGSTGLPWWRSG